MALTLGRKPGEAIVIGNDVVIRVDICRGEVKLHVTAPDDVKVLREELVIRKLIEADPSTAAIRCVAAGLSLTKYEELMDHFCANGFAGRN